MKRNKKSQPRGYYLNGKTNQYVKRNDVTDMPKSTQHPLGDAKSISEAMDIEEDRINHRKFPE